MVSNSWRLAPLHTSSSSILKLGRYILSLEDGVRPNSAAKVLI